MLSADDERDGIWVSNKLEQGTITFYYGFSLDVNDYSIVCVGLFHSLKRSDVHK